MTMLRAQTRRMWRRLHWYAKYPLGIFRSKHGGAHHLAIDAVRQFQTATAPGEYNPQLLATLRRFNRHVGAALHASSRAHDFELIATHFEYPAQRAGAAVSSCFDLSIKTDLLSIVFAFSCPYEQGTASFTHPSVLDVMILPPPLDGDAPQGLFAANVALLGLDGTFIRGDLAVPGSDMKQWRRILRHFNRLARDYYVNDYEYVKR